MPINSFLYPSKHLSLDYEVANSCRFNPGSSDYLNFETGDTTTSATKSTLSAWVKRTAIATNTVIFGHEESNSLRSAIYINTDDNFLYFQNGTNIFLTNAKFRDTSAWYHFVVTSDLSLSTASDRVKLFINGVRETSFSQENNVSQNASDSIPNFGNITVGANRYNSNEENFFDGYMAEVCFLDGQALDADQFGQFDSDSNIWKPKDVSGLTFGNNGFYLDFENSSSLGADVSGNGNNFTVNNLTSIDQTTDTCTNNFCIFTSNFKSDWTLSEGNLKCERTTGTSMLVGTSIMPTTGKWYFEVKIGEAGLGDRSRVGVMNYQSILDNSTYTGVINTPSQVLAGCVTSCKTAKHFEGDGQGVMNEYTASGDFADGDIVQIAMDLDNKAIYIGRNGTFLTQTGSSGGDPTSGSSKTGAITTNTNIMDGSPMSASTGLSVGSGSDTSTMFFNFGNPPFSISSGNSDANGYGNFEYSVPSGYYALCTKNLAEYG